MGNIWQTKIWNPTYENVFMILFRTIYQNSSTEMSPVNFVQLFSDAYSDGLHIHISNFVNCE